MLLLDVNLPILRLIFMSKFAFPLGSFLCLNPYKSGFGAMKALKILLDKDKISRDVVLMADQMYLQKEVQHNSGEYVGADGSLYKGMVVPMVQGL